MDQREAWPPKFTLDEENILELLTGDRFYANASASLRELILNALDAEYRRKLDDPTHQARIRVVFDSLTNELICEDNGDGMDRETVSTLFTRIGASASALGTGSQRTIGEFGIGVISYFLAADEFELETCNGKESAIGLRFRKAMFSSGQAEEFEASREERGTTVRLKLRDERTYQLLKDKYPHWCRGVAGLCAVVHPEKVQISQGNYVGAEPDCIDVSTPDGIESAFLRPISTVDAWEKMSGSSTVDILYRGVFVQEFEAKGLWGMTGSIFVDPKRFKPKLNREGFVGDAFKEAIYVFLQSAHPSVLDAIAEIVSDALSNETLPEWDRRKWATLWLSVPRSASYKATASKWDRVFKQIPAFEWWQGEKWSSASVSDLIEVESPIYVAPNKRSDGANPIWDAASRLLRAMGHVVVRGIEHDRRWLENVGNQYATTADLIRGQFHDDLPEMKYIKDDAEQILEAIGTNHRLFGGERPVDLVSLGEDGPPVLRLKKRLLINMTVKTGKSLVLKTLELNRGRKGLLDAAVDLTPDSLPQIASFARSEKGDGQDVFGLVKRRFIRGLIE